MPNHSVANSKTTSRNTRYTSIDARVTVMPNSVCDTHATPLEPSSYARYQSAVPSAFGRDGPPAIETHSDFSAARQLHVRTAPAAARVLQILPPDAVSRRTTKWRGMEVEIVEAKRR